MLNLTNFEMWPRTVLFMILLCLLSCRGLESSPVFSGSKILQDIPYGEGDRNKMDVYLPSHAKNAPVIFMVHGGAWRIGDKASKAVVENKVNRWVQKGFVFISTNYRMLPKAAPHKQATDVAKALAFAQNNSSSWGGGIPQNLFLWDIQPDHIL